MGPMEILLILALALIIWGPGKIPEVARTIGKVVYTLRKTTFDFTKLVTKELDSEEKDHQPQSRKASDDMTKESSDSTQKGGDQSAEADLTDKK